MSRQFVVVRALDHPDTLERVSGRYGSPKSIRVDNGPEFISKDLDLWAYMEVHLAGSKKLQLVIP